MTKLFLCKPTIKYHRSFLAAMKEVQIENNLFMRGSSEMKLDLDSLADPKNFSLYLDELERKRVSKESELDGKVPIPSYG